MPDSRVGEPRRHFSPCCDEGDRASFSLRFFIGDQSQRAYFARAVAALAMLLKNRQHIAIESWRALRLIRGRDMLSSVADEKCGGGADGKNQYMNAVAWHEHSRISYAFERLGCKRERTIAMASRIGGSKSRGRLRSLGSERDRNRRTSFQKSCRDARRVGRKRRPPTNRADLH